jgi:hypothetical protein
MSELFKRLARMTRAHLSDFIEQHWPGRRSEPGWEAESDPWHDTASPHDTSPPPSQEHRSSGLPYSEELARHYRSLDLPFGAPLAQVNKRWKTYLKKCHPDRYANDPVRQADATKLTQELTRAHEKIKAAWEQYRAQGS